MAPRQPLQGLTPLGRAQGGKQPKKAAAGGKDASAAVAAAAGRSERKTPAAAEALKAPPPATRDADLGMRCAVLERWDRSWFSSLVASLCRLQQEPERLLRYDVPLCPHAAAPGRTRRRRRRAWTLPRCRP